MKKILLLLLLASAMEAQTFPFAFWKSGTAAWDPLTVDSCKLWLDAQEITGETTGDTINIWHNRANRYRDAIQYTAAKVPVYYADSLNGKPSVWFDGVDDYLRTQRVANLGPSYTIFAVVRTYRWATNQNIVDADTNTARVFQFRTNGADLQGVDFPDLKLPNKAMSYASNPPGVVAAIIAMRNGGAAGDSVKVAVNNSWGTALLLASTGTATSVVGLAVGINQFNGSTANPYRFNVGEVLYFNKALTQGEINYIYDGLKTKWGL